LDPPCFLRLGSNVEAEFETLEGGLTVEVADLNVMKSRTQENNLRRTNRQ
jgi:hypothetical protein